MLAVDACCPALHVPVHLPPSLPQCVGQHRLNVVVGTHLYRRSASSMTPIDTRAWPCVFRSTSSSVFSSKKAITLRRSVRHISGNVRGAWGPSDAEAVVAFSTLLMSGPSWCEHESWGILAFNMREPEDAHGAWRVTGQRKALRVIMWVVSSCRRGSR